MAVRNRGVIPALVITITLGIGVLIGSFVSHGVRAAKSPAGADARALPPPSVVELPNSFAKIAADVGPAVVNIKTESTVKVSRKRFHGNRDEGQDDLFDHFFHFGVPDGQGSEIPQQSLGSGMILDKSGYILTNYHVVMRDGEDRPADRMRVLLQDDDDSAKGYPATVVGADKLTDLAVVKVDVGRSLTAVQFGDSDSMRVGDWVLAFGSPFGLNSTVTAGIVSAKGRDIEPGRDGEFKRFVQTDAAINPGNSGGPLVNLAGQVIGINTAIETGRGVSDGVGFAIPSNTARKVYNSIVTNGSVRRGAIGVSFLNVKNEAVLHSLGADHGVVVDDVEPGSPAERAGIQRGDVIVAIDSKPIHGGDDLLAIVSETEPGTKLKVDYLRERKTGSAVIAVGEWNKIVGQANQQEQARPESEAEHSGGALGLSVKSLPPDQAREISGQLHLTGPHGVLVSDVKPGGFAEDVGLQRYDVVLSINQKTVSSVDDFNRLQSQLKSGEDVLFLIARRNGRSFTTLFLADRLP
jgi:serine protease Do